MDPTLFHRFESPLNRIWHSFLSVLLFSLSQANEQAEDNEAGDGILIKWEGELGHWLGNAGEGTSLILTAMRAMQNRKKKSLKWDLWVSAAAEGDKSGLQLRVLEGLSKPSISVRFWWDTSTCCSGALQKWPGSCAAAQSGQVTTSSGFCPGGAAFLPQAQRAGETWRCRVPSRPLFHFKATRTRVLLCLSSAPRNHRVGLLCGLLPLLFSMYIWGKKKLLFTFPG